MTVSSHTLNASAGLCRPLTNLHAIMLTCRVRLN